MISFACLVHKCSSIIILNYKEEWVCTHSFWYWLIIAQMYCSPIPPSLPPPLLFFFYFFFLYLHTWWQRLGLCEWALCIYPTWKGHNIYKHLSLCWAEVLVCEDCCPIIIGQASVCLLAWMPQKLQQPINQCLSDCFLHEGAMNYHSRAGIELYFLLLATNCVMHL